MESSRKTFQVLLLGMVLIIGCRCQNSAPVFSKDMDNIELLEDTEVESIVYTLEAHDPDNQNAQIRYFIIGDMFTCDEVTGVVKLSRPLDFEREKRLKIRVRAIDEEDQQTTYFVTIKVRDTNDNKPQFSNDTYAESLEENNAPNTIVIPSITVNDVDYNNAELIDVYCDPSIAAQSQDPKVCEKFGVERISHTNRDWIGRLVTKQRLDFEKTTAYQVPLVAYDGKLKTNKSIEITIKNIADTPPHFTKENSVTVDEGIEPGNVVNNVIAVDGDRVDPRPIRYEIFRSSVPGIFEIDDRIGDIKTLVKLDRENLTDAFVSLWIRAREVISANPEKLGDDPLTTVTTSIRINVLDVNDNAPIFDPSHFETTINENHQDNTGIGVTLTVTDRDQGSAGGYRIILANEVNRFAVFPDSGQGTSFAGVKVINSSLIDYETMGPDKRYILQVYARELVSTGIVTSTATVTVNIRDVNDNSPKFSSNDYVTQVSELAPAGTVVIDYISVEDPDSLNMGKAGVRYQLRGSGSDKFSIDAKTGVVTVNVCTKPTPGKSPCLDYEKTKQYDLTVMAEDQLGQGSGKRRSTASLRINVLPENDNPPVFTIGNYESFIVDGDTEPNPVIQLQVSDRDSTNIDHITFTVSKEDIPGLWRVNSQLKLVGTTGVEYSKTPNKKGIYIVNIDASDGKYTATATATVSVLETNNFDPKFDQDVYTETIDENTPGSISILTVSATDQDPSNTLAGQIDTYTLTSGTQGKFTINEQTGEIRTAPDATFDYDLQKQYTMIVSVADKYRPRRIGDAIVYINIRDANNKNPYLVPLTHRAEIPENEPVGNPVIKIFAKDPDDKSKIEFAFIDPISAINPEGVVVNRDIYDYTTLFYIERATGQVRVNRTMDRDSASVVTLTVKVTDVAASPVQTGSGTLIVNILEYNDQPPEFEKPWRTDYPFYNITVPEELPLGTWITTLIAIDEDDTIEEYRLKTPPGLFNVDSQTGVVSVRSRMDFEKIESATFQALAFDSGRPQLSALATIFVSILNENDNSPLFTQDVYEKTIAENSPAGTYIETVSATDQDKGDYGVVRYSIADKRFLVDEITGRITVNAGADLDREKEALIAIQVEAYDSPLNRNKSRTNYIPVYISLRDENDNDPGFTLPEYSATIIETIPPGRDILQILCTDLDSGYNADVRYFKVSDSSDPNNFFRIGKAYGQISVGRSLLGHAGRYTFNVFCEDEQADGPTKRKATSKVTITVLKATNSPPQWIIPARENMTVYVLEEQYLGMIVYDVKAVDYDEAEDGRVTYGFYTGNDYSTKTGDFEINPITGVISADIVYDRETIDSYRLLLIARDNGFPFLESTRFLTVRILDVNDHVPRFPMENGVTIPYVFYATENAKSLPVLIDTVTAIDEDLAEYADIFYYIVGGNEDGAFSIGLKTGEIFMVEQIDHEKQSEIDLVVMATNNISDYSVIRNRKKRSADPNVVTVQIRVKDVNDEKPVFKKQKYYGCVNKDAPYDQSIVRVEAEDKDSLGAATIYYSIIEGNEGNQFAIKTGVVSNKKLMRPYSGQTFDLIVEALDAEQRINAQSATAEVKVFVTETNNEVKLVLAQPATEVRLFVNQIQRVLAEQFSEDIKYVCILEVKDHVIDEADSDSSQIWSDVYVAAADVNGVLFGTDTLLGKLNEKSDRFSILHLKYIEPAKTDKSLIDRTPVLAVLILVVILILLALIVLIVACYCIYKSKRHRLEKNEIERHHIVKSEVVDTSPVIVAAPVPEPMIVENTEYDNAVFIPDPEPEPELVKEPISEPEPEPVYSIVNKGSRPPSDVDITPPPEIETKQVEIDVAESPLPSPPESPRDSYRIETDVIDSKDIIVIDK